MTSGWQLLWPWMFLALPLPWLLYFLSRNKDAIRIPQGHLFAASTSPRITRQPNWIAVLVWLLLLLAAARPQWIGEAIRPDVPARDIVMVIDISRSMQQSDMSIGNFLSSRLDAVKHVVRNFIARRKGDRLALLLFGERPYWYVPLTFDLDALNDMLQEAQEGWAGNGTAIGDAILLAVAQLRDQPASQRTVILLTDGTSNRGTPVLQAAQEAAAEGIKIYTIGIGSGQNNILSMALPAAGYDAQTLATIARTTNGKFYNASQADELEQVYNEISRIERHKIEAEPHYPIVEWFRTPLLFGLGIMLLSMLSNTLRYRRA